MSKWITGCKLSELPIGKRKLLEFDGTPIALFNLDGEYFAFNDVCPHNYLPLGDGAVSGSSITCPFHGAVFCIKTGVVKSGPAVDDLTTLPTRVVDDLIQIQVDD